MELSQVLWYSSGFIIALISMKLQHRCVKAYDVPRLLLLSTFGPAMAGVAVFELIFELIFGEREIW